MNKYGLSDLDELMFTVKNGLIRSYVLEAINAYRGGAYRAAIITIWVAVVFDIINKIRELSINGDKNALQFITELDNNVNSQNINKLQSIEQKILDTAKDEFQFLLPHEYDDLVRIRNDRHLCAHPAYIKHDILFQPSPELVRCHIVHAIIHLLQHQPVQGKSAIKLIIDDIERDLFPSDFNSINNFLCDKYFKRSKDVLITNLIKRLLKQILNDDNKIEMKLLFSFISISKAKFKIFEKTLLQILPPLTVNMNDKQIKKLLLILCYEPMIWNWINSIAKTQIRSLFSKFNDTSKKIEFITSIRIDCALKIPELKNDFLKIYKNLNSSVKAEIILNNPIKEFLNDAISIFRNSGNFRSAENNGKIILQMTPFMDEKHIIEVINSFKKNTQISHAGGIPQIFELFFDKTKNHSNKIKMEWKQMADYISQHPHFELSFFRGLLNKIETQLKEA